jgi:predicted nucleic acid-binding protein
MRLYFDACTVIYFVERKEADRVAAVSDALYQRFQHSPLICWTDLTRMECRVKPLAEQNSSLLANFELFFARPDTKRFDLPPSVFDRATELRACHRLKTPDALHLAAAIEAGCTEFWTNDHRLDSAASGYLNTVTL